MVNRSTTERSAIVGITPADSVTHQHIAATINTLLGRSIHMSVARVLDFGCGDGRLLSHVLASLSALRPTIRFEVFGLDVVDAGQQEAGYFDRTRRYLEGQFPH